jgi:hypothetical protein
MARKSRQSRKDQKSKARKTALSPSNLDLKNLRNTIRKTDTSKWLAIGAAAVAAPVAYLSAGYLRRFDWNRLSEFANRMMTNMRPQGGMAGSSDTADASATESSSRSGDKRRRSSTFRSDSPTATPVH